MKVVYIRSRRTAFAKDGHPALKCHPNGHVQANRFGKGLQWEQWTLHLNVDGDSTMVALQAWTGKFLSAKNCGDVRADCDHIGESEKWKIESSNKGEIFVALKSWRDKYLVCDNSFDCGNSVRADRDKLQEWEEWAIVDDPDAFTNPGHTAKCAIGGCLIAAGSIATLGALAVPLLGFGVEGVVAGSIAASVQSAFCGGATTGLFSVLQSAGATLAWAPVCAGGAVATGAGTTIVASKK